LICTFPHLLHPQNTWPCCDFWAEHTPNNVCIINSLQPPLGHYVRPQYSQGGEGGAGRAGGGEGGGVVRYCKLQILPLYMATKQFVCCCGVKERLFGHRQRLSTTLWLDLGRLSTFSLKLSTCFLLAG